MKYTLAVLLVVVGIFASYARAGNDYYWGDLNPQADYLISRQTVKKAFVLGLVVSTKYVYKQSDNLNAYTITAIKVYDQMKSNGGVAELISGGPGSKGATILFNSQRGHGINSVVEIYGR